MNNPIQHRFVALAAAVSLGFIGSTGCGSDVADQPDNPANSTLQQPSVSNVPEGNPVQPADPGSTDAPVTSGSDMGG